MKNYENHPDQALYEKRCESATDLVEIIESQYQAFDPEITLTGTSRWTPDKKPDHLFCLVTIGQNVIAKRISVQFAPDHAEIIGAICDGRNIIKQDGTKVTRDLVRHDSTIKSLPEQKFEQTQQDSPEF